MHDVKAFLVGTFIESMLYGVYSVLFVSLVWVILIEKTINRWVAALCFASFCSSTMHVVVDFQTLRQAFGVHSNPLVADSTFVNSTLRILRSVSWGISNLLATSVLIWRMYYLWKGKHWVCVIPSVALVIWVVVFILSAADEFRSRQLITFEFSCSLATNVISACLLGVKVWWERRKVPDGYVLNKSTTWRFYYNLTSVILNSGIIYTACIIILYVLHITKNSAEKIIDGIDSQIPGIVTSSLVLCIALAKPTDITHRGETGNTLFGTTLVAAHSGSPNDHDEHDRGKEEGYELQECIPEQDITDISRKEIDFEKAVVFMSSDNDKEPVKGRFIEVGSFPGMLGAKEELSEDQTFFEEAQDPLDDTEPEVVWRMRPLPPVDEDVEPGSNANVRQLSLPRRNGGRIVVVQ